MERQRSTYDEREDGTVTAKRESAVVDLPSRTITETATKH
jgi:hypothetical protein